MDLKFFDHDGRRWIEGEYEGRPFALSEDGTRLILETPLYGHGCFVGTTLEDFIGRRVGVLRWREDAIEWMHGALSADPQRIDKKGRKRSLLTIPIPANEEAPCS